MIILPRQAQDKHRENSKKMPFFAPDVKNLKALGAFQTCRGGGGRGTKTCPFCQHSARLPRACLGKSIGSDSFRRKGWEQGETRERFRVSNCPLYIYVQYSFYPDRLGTNIEKAKNCLVVGVNRKVLAKLVGIAATFRLRNARET